MRRSRRVQEQKSVGDVHGPIGIQLDQNAKTGEVEVVSPIDDSPAFKAGILAGDVILKINGEDIKATKLDEVIKKIANGCR